MKLLFFSPNSEIGGAEAVLIEDVKALAKTNHEIHLILPKQGKVSEVLANIGITIHYVKFDWWIALDDFSIILKLKFFRGLILSSLKIKNVIAKVKPDVVITNTIGSPVGALGAFWAGVKHVWYIHELGKEDHGLYFIYGEKLSYRIIEKLSNRIILNSKFVENKIIKYIKNKKFDLFYYSVEIPALDKYKKQNVYYLNYISQPIKLIMTGRVMKGKRQEDAIKGIEILKKHYGVAAHLTIIGDRGGDYSDSLKDYVNTYQLSENITFVSFSDDVYSYYMNADIALVCSACEAFGRVTIEAMKLRTIVIASNTGANPELIGDNERGFLYEMGNPIQLAQVIIEAQKDANRLQQVSENAYKWSWEVCNTEVHINKLLNTLKNA